MDKLDLEKGTESIKDFETKIGYSLGLIQVKINEIVEWCNKHQPEELKYDKNFGDEKMCKCGHPYYRHFDTYDNMAPVGCKYCECRKFEELK